MLTQEEDKMRELARICRKCEKLFGCKYRGNNHDAIECANCDKLKHKKFCERDKFEFPKALGGICLDCEVKNEP